MKFILAKLYTNIETTKYNFHKNFFIQPFLTTKNMETKRSMAV